MSYEQFKEFHGKHPNMDNTEYYAEFPETNKSTIRSWKNRIRTPKPIPMPTKEEAAEHIGLREEMVKILCTQTGTPLTEFDGVDNKAALIILRNKAKNQEFQEANQKTSRTSNSSILPNPAPIGQKNEHFGLDPYINFDVARNEIRMEIPWDVLIDPEKNRRLGELK